MCSHSRGMLQRIATLQTMITLSPLFRRPHAATLYARQYTVHCFQFLHVFLICLSKMHYCKQENYSRPITAPVMSVSAFLHQMTLTTKIFIKNYNIIEKKLYFIRNNNINEASREFKVDPKNCKSRRTQECFLYLLKLILQDMKCVGTRGKNEQQGESAEKDK